MTKLTCHSLFGKEQIHFLIPMLLANIPQEIQIPNGYIERYRPEDMRFKSIAMLSISLSILHTLYRI